MKKLLALLLCVIFAVSLCACDKDDKDDKKEKKATTSESTAETSKPDETSEPDETKKPGESSEPSGKTGEGDEEFTLVNGTFKCEAAGISFKVPSDWKAQQVLFLISIAKNPVSQETQNGAALMPITDMLTDGKKISFKDIYNNPTSFSENLSIKDGVTFKKTKLGGKDAVCYTDTSDPTMIMKGYILDCKVPVILYVQYKKGSENIADDIFNSVKYIH